jgi:hypothetical protein
VQSTEAAPSHAEDQRTTRILEQDARRANVELYFGPSASSGCEDRWIQTIPGRGWFVHLRRYGPDQPAFEGTWRLGDFEAIG